MSAEHMSLTKAKREMYGEYVDGRWVFSESGVRPILAARTSTATADTGLRERVTSVLGDLLRYYAERRDMANPKGWDHVLRQFETAAESHYRLSEPQAAEVRSVLTDLAARTSTATADTAHSDQCYDYNHDAGWREYRCICDDAATADTGLRERVEAAREQIRQQMLKAEFTDDRNTYGDGYGNGLAHALDFLRPALATPASTEDRADNEGTRE